MTEGQKAGMGRLLDGIRSVVRKGGYAVHLKICLIFALVGTAWVFVEHSLLGGPAIYKDIFFILATTWMLFWLVEHGLGRIRKSEEALRESQEHLQEILETNPCGIILVDRQGILQYANSATAVVLGLERERIVGRPYDEAGWEVSTADGSPVPTEERPGFRVLRKGELLIDKEYSVKRPDGGRVILSVNSGPLFSSEGAIVGMVASFFDISERKKEELLTLQKLYLAAQQTPTTIMITDPDCRIEYVNPSFARMTGHAAEEAVGTRVSGIGERSPGIFGEILSAIGDRVRWSGVCESLRKDGEPYWEAIDVSPVRGLDGEVAHYLWVREDITEKRKGEEALRESRERYRNLVESISDCVWEVDPDLTIQYVSPKIWDQLGYEPEEVVRRTPFDLMPSFEVNRLSATVRDIKSRGISFERVEAIALHKDGRFVVLETNGVPIRSPEGIFLGWRMVSRDISERKQAEEALRESEERFRQIFVQNEEPVLLFRSGTAEILDANPAAVSLYGYSLEELRARGPSLFLRPGAVEEFSAWVGGIREGHPLSVDRTTHAKRDGTQILVSIRGKTIRLREGVVSYCTFRDITDRIRSEEEAKSRQAQLIHASRMASLGTMVSGVAHEINNPNNLIMFNSPMLRAAWGDAERILARRFEEVGDFPVGGLPYSEMRGIVPRLFEGIAEASQRIRNIVTNLKDFSRPESSRLDCAIDVNEVVKASIAIVNHQILKRTRNFRVEYGALSPRVLGCAQQLEQVVINLILNALDSLPAPGSGVRVTTSSDRDSGRVEIVVEDEGIGMPREVIPRVTEPFFSTKAETGGLGLGLSLSLSIVQDHKGELIFESEVGKGTTVRIVLPAIGDPMDTAPPVSVPKYSGKNRS